MSKSHEWLVRYPDGSTEPLVIEIRSLPRPKTEAVYEPVIETRLPEYHHHKEPLSTSILLGIGVVALTGVIVGLGMSVRSSEAQPINKATSITAVSNSEGTGLEVQANNSALAEAKLIAEHLNKNFNGDTSRMTVTLVNGTILKNTATPNTGIAVYEPIMQNAILLSTAGNQTPDMNGKFLNGAWLGVIGPKDTLESPMTVGIIQYDSNSMRFQASGEPTIMASILTTPVNLIGVGIAHETLAFDTSSLTQLYNGSRPVYVGEDLTR